MHRIEGAHVDTENGKTYFRSDPPYTTLTAEFCNAVQEEIMNVIAALGLPVLGKDNDTRDQLYTAINGLSSVPIGSILAWLPGYFTDGSNGGYTAVTSIELPGNWKECTGANINDSNSPIFNGAGRYIANLTDDRFLMGDVAGSAGGIGGDNTISAHTHTVPAHYHGMGTGATLNITSSGSHTHVPDSYANIMASGSGSNGITIGSGIFSFDFSAALVASSHAHTSGNFSGLIGLVTGGVNGNASMTSGSDGGIDNRPKYLSCRYIQRIR